MRLRKASIFASFYDGRGFNMNFACLHFAHRLEQFSRKVAFGLIGCEFALGKWFILRGDDVSPLTLNR